MFIEEKMYISKRRKRYLEELNRNMHGAKILIPYEEKKSNVADYFGSPEFQVGLYDIKQGYNGSLKSILRMD